MSTTPPEPGSTPLPTAARLWSRLALTAAADDIEEAAGDSERISTAAVLRTLRDSAHGYLNDQQMADAVLATTRAADEALDPDLPDVRLRGTALMCATTVWEGCGTKMTNQAMDDGAIVGMARQFEAYLRGEEWPASWPDAWPTAADLVDRGGKPA